MYILFVYVLCFINYMYRLAADFTFICMLGSLCKFFYDQREYESALLVCHFILGVCKIMQPEYNFVSI